MRSSKRQIDHWLKVTQLWASWQRCGLIRVKITAGIMRACHIPGTVGSTLWMLVAEP